MRHLDGVAKIGDIARSYLTEGLDCYVAGLFKAGSVMVGGAAERIILDLHDAAVNKLKSLVQPVPQQLEDWRIKTVTDGLRTLFEGRRAQFDRRLQESFDANWSTLAHQIRVVRNDAGHPVSVDPVTPDTVRASLLVFPELAKLAHALADWVANQMK